MKPDKEQKNAAKYINGHSLIIAGAGTGKTTTLLFKIKYLIDKGIKENEILVISFTNETVNNFKNKCPYNINVLTFHKTANLILNNNQEIVDDDLLKDFIKNLLIRFNKKTKRKIYHILFLDIYTSKKFYSKLDQCNSNSITDYFYSLIKQIKTNHININDLDSKIFTKNELFIIYCVNIILTAFNNKLKENNLIDFDDLIIDATNKVNNGIYISKYKHILVDEYQDISFIRLELLKALIKNNNAILTAVGDDFQSIYNFSGSNIQLFYDFQNYFYNSKLFYIKTTYRCPQNLISKAGKFIMKNPNQIKKNLLSKSNKNGIIKKIFSFDYRKDLLKILNIYINTNKSVLILGRNNFDINNYIYANMKINETYLLINGIKHKNIRYLTIHSAKGLEADVVIIINLSNKTKGLPNKENNNLINKITLKKFEFKYAEERRLFYVALTRCKSDLYLIVDAKNPSIFVKEI